MKKALNVILLLISFNALAQQTGTIAVGGDFDKFYPVVFRDATWASNIATELEIGRSSVHTDSDWRGSLIAKFRYHNTRWGHGASFLSADIFQIRNVMSVNTISFIAGWRDASGSSTNDARLIWLRGGGTTYYYNANGGVAPVVYDGVQNMLPFDEGNGVTNTYKTAVDSYVNSGGLSVDGTGYFNGTGQSYFASMVGIGTTNPTEMLSVKGKIRSQEIIVETSNWPDYVFEKDYKLPKLSELKAYIDKNGHLPGVPNAVEAEKDGVKLGQLNKILLKKIEELTLHLLEKEDELNKQKVRADAQELRLEAIEKRMTNK